MSLKKIDKIQSSSERLTMGKHTSHAFRNDPKHLAFSMSRYKFVSKILEDYNSALEVGAGDGFQSEIVRQNVKNLTLSDIAEYNKKDYLNSFPNRSNYLIHDFTKKKLSKKFEAIYLNDVLEHIPKNKEVKFIKNIKYSLKKKWNNYCWNAHFGKPKVCFSS